MSYLLRLVLPDRPGALGAVATALGTVGADILSVDVIERSPGSAIDDFVVELPPDKLADSLVTAAATVEGVHVESIRPYAGQIDPHRELELLEALARDPRVERWRCSPTAPPGSSGPAGRSCSTHPVDGQCRVLASGGAAPELASVPAPWWPPAPARALDADAAWAPADWERLGTELAVSPLGDARAAGRPPGAALAAVRAGAPAAPRRDRGERHAGRADARPRRPIVLGHAELDRRRHP